MFHLIFIRREWDCSTGLSSAITPAATYLMSDVEEIEGESIYARYGNPSRNSVEAILASLEGADHAMCFSSGTVEPIRLDLQNRSKSIVCLGNDLQ